MSKEIQVQFRAARSRAEIETLVGEIALLAADQRRLAAQMDDELAAVRSGYEVPLAEVAAGLRQRTAAVQEWAEANPGEFARRKSIEFAQGTVGFRTSPPKLALLSRKWTWEAVIAAIKSRSWFTFIRVREELDKERILGLAGNAADARQFSDEMLKPIGVKIVRDESFFVSPKLAVVETRQVAAA